MHVYLSAIKLPVSAQGWVRGGPGGVSSLKHCIIEIWFLCMTDGLPRLAKVVFFPFRFWLNNIFYTNHWYIFSLTKSGQMFSVTFTISCTVSAQMYMCSWRFSWRAVNPQWARRTEMGRGNRVQGALGRGIVGTLLLVALPTIRYFLPTILERNR